MPKNEGMRGSSKRKSKLAEQCTHSESLSSSLWFGRNVSGHIISRTSTLVLQPAIYITHVMTLPSSETSTQFTGISAGNTRILFRLGTRCISCYFVPRVRIPRLHLHVKLSLVNIKRSLASQSWVCLRVNPVYCKIPNRQIWSRLEKILTVFFDYWTATTNTVDFGRQIRETILGKLRHTCVFFYLLKH